MYEKIQETVRAIVALYRKPTRIGLILGSGLGSFADVLENRCVIPFESLPHFPKSTAEGHAGNLVLGESENVPVAVLQGRVHFYEGYSLAETTYPVRVLGCLGVKEIIISNAAGAISPRFSPGDLMLITDHINLMGGNPLIGKNVEELGPRFPDMSAAYNPTMREIALQAAAHLGLELGQGVYVGFAGPSYETPAEIRMCRYLGGDAVGMSTVPEVIAANHMAMRVLGISCITNMAAGIVEQRLTHQDVIEITGRVSQRFAGLLRAIINRLAAAEALEGGGFK
jgi:purine-nucleoside phosphorylase